MSRELLIICSDVAIPDFLRSKLRLVQTGDSIRDVAQHGLGSSRSRVKGAAYRSTSCIGGTEFDGRDSSRMEAEGSLPKARQAHDN